MKPVALQLPIVLALLVAAAWAQTTPPAADKVDEFMETGMEASGISTQYYNEDGELMAEVYGGHAKVIESRAAEVTHLRIDVFQEGEVYATVYAPKCVTRVVEKGDHKVLEVVSEGDVLLDMEEMTISGRGFRFSSDQNRFEILSDSKVLVKESARDIKGIDL